MADASIAEVAVNMARTAAAGGRFEDSGVPDTPAARKLWDDIQADIAAMPEGVIVDIPWDYASSAEPAEVSRSVPVAAEDDERLDEVDVDALEADADLLAAEVVAEAQRFNMNHAPPGPGGGQFATASGASDTPASRKAAQKKKLHERAQALRAEAAAKVKQLDGLLVKLKAAAKAHRAAKRAVAQAKASTAHQTAAQKHAAAAVKKQAASAKSASYAAKHPKAAAARRKAAAAATHHTRRARTYAQHVTSLHSRITALRGQIKHLRTQAAALDKRAGRL